MFLEPDVPDEREAVKEDAPVDPDPLEECVFVVEEGDKVVPPPFFRHPPWTRICTRFDDPLDSCVRPLQPHLQSFACVCHDPLQNAVLLNERILLSFENLTFCKKSHLYRMKPD